MNESNLIESFKLLIILNSSKFLNYSVQFDFQSFLEGEEQLCGLVSKIWL